MNRQSSIAPIEDWLGNFIAAVTMGRLAYRR